MACYFVFNYIEDDFHPSWYTFHSPWKYPAVVFIALIACWRRKKCVFWSFRYICTFVFNWFRFFFFCARCDRSFWLLSSFKHLTSLHLVRFMVYMQFIWFHGFRFFFFFSPNDIDFNERTAPFHSYITVLWIMFNTLKKKKKNSCILALLRFFALMLILIRRIFPWLGLFITFASMKRHKHEM